VTYKHNCFNDHFPGLPGLAGGGLVKVAEAVLNTCGVNFVMLTNSVKVWRHYGVSNFKPQIFSDFLHTYYCDFLEVFFLL